MKISAVLRLEFIRLACRANDKNKIKKHTSSSKGKQCKFISY